MTWWAPKRLASVSFASSLASPVTMMHPAPASRQAITLASPLCPGPRTTTVSPGLVPGRSTAQRKPAPSGFNNTPTPPPTAAPAPPRPAPAARRHLADLPDDAHGLVAGDDGERRRQRPRVLLVIAAADAASLYPQERVLRPDLGQGELLPAQAARPFLDDCAAIASHRSLIRPHP